MDAFFTTSKAVLMAVQLELLLAAKRDGAPHPEFELNTSSLELDFTDQKITRVGCKNVHHLMQFIGRVADNGEDGLVEVR